MRIGVASCRVGQGGWGHLPSSPSRPCSQAPTSLVMCCLKPVISAAFRFHIYFLKAICSTVCRTSWIVLVLDLPEPENPAGFVVCRGKGFRSICGFYSFSEICFSREKARLASDPEVDKLGLSGSDTLTNGSRLADVAAAKRLAKRLFNLDGFRKSDVARHLSKKWAIRT